MKFEIILCFVLNSFNNTAQDLLKLVLVLKVSDMEYNRKFRVFALDIRLSIARRSAR